MAHNREFLEPKGNIKDFNTVILERKKAPNCLVVNEAISDDNIVVCLHRDTSEKLQLFHGNTILIKGKKGKDTIYSILVDETYEEPRIRMYEVVCSNLSVRLRDVALVHQCLDVNVMYDKRVHILPIDDKTSCFPSLQGRAYNKMENIGWIKLENLDMGIDKLLEPECQIFCKRRSHTTVSSDERRLAGFQMILKPYDIISGIDIISTFENAAPACVLYVVLKKHMNSIAKDVNDISFDDIHWPTRYNQSWMVWKAFLPDADQPRDFEWERIGRLPAPYGISDNDEVGSLLFRILDPNPNTRITISQFFCSTASCLAMVS